MNIRSYIDLNIYEIHKNAKNTLFQFLKYLIYNISFKLHTIFPNVTYYTKEHLHVVLKLIFPKLFLLNILFIMNNYNSRTTISYKYMTLLFTQCNCKFADDYTMNTVIHMIQYICDEILNISYCYAKKGFSMYIDIRDIYKTFNNDNEYIKLLENCNIVLPLEYNIINSNTFYTYIIKFLPDDVKLQKKTSQIVQKILEKRIQKTLNKIKLLMNNKFHKHITKQDVLLVIN